MLLQWEDGSPDEQELQWARVKRLPNALLTALDSAGRGIDITNGLRPNHVLFFPSSAQQPQASFTYTSGYLRA